MSLQGTLFWRTIILTCWFKTKKKKEDCTYVGSLVNIRLDEDVGGRIQNEEAAGGEKSNPIYGIFRPMCYTLHYEVSSIPYRFR